VRPYLGDTALAEKGIITFEIGIHGIPVTMDPMVYNNLGAGALNNYWTFNLDNKNNYYYKRVYLGCVRANDFIFSLPQFDGVNLCIKWWQPGWRIGDHHSSTGSPRKMARIILSCTLRSHRIS
jgi:cephalosporin-C deacetylase-like acetyl esterase